MILKNPFARVDDVYDIPKPSDPCIPCGGGQTSPSSNVVCGVPSPANTPPRLRRGQLPAVIPLCSGDVIIRAGRQNALNVPVFAIEELYARGMTAAPHDPVASAGSVAGGVLTLTLTFPAPVGTAQGQGILTPGMIVEIGTSNNVAPGTTQFQASGTFEDGTPYLQQFEVSQASIGNSKFLVTFSKEVGGGTYPSLIDLSNAVIVSGAGVAIPLTAGAAPNDATSATPTNGVRSPNRGFQLDVLSGADGTRIRVELLTPDSQFYDAGLRYFYQSLGGRF